MGGRARLVRLPCFSKSVLERVHTMTEKQKQTLRNVFAVGAVLVGILLVLLLAVAAVAFFENNHASEPEYVTRLFDNSRVHTIDLQVADWDAFLENAPQETYIPCTAVIDGEAFPLVGLRAKGNNSLHLVEENELCRYSLKLEFDQYTAGANYYGLDKFSLDSSFQDNSYLKTFLVYELMERMGVPAPLCSYVYVTVNGVDWGLFLAIEEPEEAFAARNFGSDYGKLYKPDYRSLQEENADIALKYIDDNPQSYPNIFDNAKFSITTADQARLIAALKTLSTGENLESAVAVDEVLRYFTVQVFVMNWDSYLGRTGHNYFLYEEDGVVSILPWDYNLAFGTYALAMTNPITDPNILINHPIDTPAEGEVMQNRPLYHILMQNPDYFARYHAYFDQLLADFFENGKFETWLTEISSMIAPYVEKDPTAFCSYEDHQLAVETLRQVVLLRAESARGQLDGRYPSTFRQLEENPTGVDCSSINLFDLGDLADLSAAKSRQDAARRAVAAAE